MIEWINDHGMLAAIFALAGLSVAFGALLGYAGERFRVEGDPLVERIDALLPQTQCGQCGYPGCKPYAEAISGGDAINKCPPGGDATIAALADLLGREASPLDGEAQDAPRVAYIREDECIGCTKCIQACPVDAILGAAKHMHTVIADECTGCDLCLDPCPVDCIDMIARDDAIDAWQPPLPAGPGHRPAAQLIVSDRAHTPREATHG
ncbi:electron transport complex subunit RsxB [Onishia niordana]|uniref:electron transport complex subunit RsxB n=1 Tax=Onishia niordana TaxID=2508711 RepID=UPI00109FDD45|nr:electron transport complex subunit RsxB [Halomonas niordiana]